MAAMAAAWLLAWCVSMAGGFTGRAYVPSLARTRLSMSSGAIDMNDPLVVAEFKKINQLMLDSVKYELEKLGIPFSDVASDMDLRLMLMEARIRLADNPAKAEAPPADAGRFQKLAYEKPAIMKAWETYLDKGDINRANAFTEYIDNREMAEARYGDQEIYRKVFEYAEELIKAPAFVSNKVAFDGFPAGMGDNAIQVSFKEFGEITSLQTKNADDPTAISCSGIIEFATVEAAEAAVAKWDGVDMGLGQQLTLKYLA